MKNFLTKNKLLLTAMSATLFWFLMLILLISLTLPKKEKRTEFKFLKILSDVVIDEKIIIKKGSILSNYKESFNKETGVMTIENKIKDGKVEPIRIKEY